MKIVHLPKKLKCKRCGHSWYPRGEQVTICPDCKSPYWFKDRIRKNLKSLKNREKTNG